MSHPGFCEQCGTHRPSLHRDHIIPVALGGQDIESNIQYLCANCHQDKTAVDIKEILNLPENREKARQTATGRKATDVARKRMSDSLQVAMKQPETKLRKSEAAKRLWSDPDFRSRMTSIQREVQSRVQGEVQNRPEVSAKKRATWSQKDRWTCECGCEQSVIGLRTRWYQYKQRTCHICHRDLPDPAAIAAQKGELPSN